MLRNASDHESLWELRASAGERLPHLLILHVPVPSFIWWSDLEIAEADQVRTLL